MPNVYVIECKTLRSICFKSLGFHNDNIHNNSVQNCTRHLFVVSK